MKRSKLRRISVDGKAYRWNYMYDDMDLVNYPYSYYVFVPEENPRFKVRVYFTKYAPQMKLDVYVVEGTICQYQGEPALMNLCRPFFAAQVIRYVLRTAVRIQTGARSKSGTGKRSWKVWDIQTFIFHSSLCIGHPEERVWCANQPLSQ